MCPTSTQLRRSQSADSNQSCLFCAHCLVHGCRDPLSRAHCLAHGCRDPQSRTVFDSKPTVLSLPGCMHLGV